MSSKMQGNFSCSEPESVGAEGDVSLCEVLLRWKSPAIQD